jgi:hypothetical protein
MDGKDMMTSTKINIKDMIINNLNEMARRNPEQNPKDFLIDNIKSFSNDPNMYLHFSNQNMVTPDPMAYKKYNGDYPQPMGIFVFPVDVILTHYIPQECHNPNPETGAYDRDCIINNWSYSEFPYASFIKYNGKGKFVNDISTYKYDQREMENDLIGVDKVIRKYADLVAKTDPENYDEEYSEFFNYISNKHKHFMTYNNGFPYDSFQDTATVIGEDAEVHPNKVFTEMLLSCGYSGIVDREGGIIDHIEDEDIQGLFVDPTAYTVVKTIVNDISLRNKS